MMICMPNMYIQLICERIVMLIYRDDVTTTSLYHFNVNFRFNTFEMCYRLRAGNEKRRVSFPE